MHQRSDVCIVIPAYNEGRIIAQVLAELTQLSYMIVLVDDGSSDNTTEQARLFPVTVLQHACNLGQGAALQTGINYALHLPQIRFIVTFDSDGQHSTRDMAALLEPLRRGTHDVVLGSRFLQKNGVVNMTLQKRVLLRLAVAFTRITTRLQVTDTHNGLRAFTVDAAAKITITQNRMAHASEMLSQIAAFKLRYCEVPVTITYTPYSRAKGQRILDSINIVWELMVERVR